ASAKAPYTEHDEPDFWRDNVVAPSGGAHLQWDHHHVIHREISIEKIQEAIQAFGAAAARAARAGMDTVEIHGAHGYLIHNFLSPLTNHRTDKYGGSLENRARFLLEVIEVVRANFPAEKPIFLRLSASDLVEEVIDGPSWEIEQTIQVAQWVRDAGVDELDVSSSGNTAQQKITAGPEITWCLTHARPTVKKIIFVVLTETASSIITGPTDMTFLNRTFAIQNSPELTLRSAYGSMPALQRKGVASRTDQKLFQKKPNVFHLLSPGPRGPACYRAPAFLQELVGGVDARSADLRNNIRKYKSALFFTLMSTKINEGLANGHWIYTFRIQGTIVHQLVFCHVQLYAALRRCTDSNNLKVLIENITIDSQEGVYTRNIVYTNAPADHRLNT
ncbi:hypothetical protein BG011_006208, partial [Mortierella polycephala]